MKIIMTFVVRDEEDIIGHNIAFHLSKGVDFFIAIDHRSVDSTPEILKKFAKKGILDYSRTDDPFFNQSKWVTKMARKASSEYSTDWIINSDADEFWMPDEGRSLKEAFSTIPPEYGKIHLKRFDYLFQPYADSIFYKASNIRENVHKWTKCCHKSDPNVEVHEGNHDINTNVLEQHGKSAPIKILHFPIRNRDRYKKSIEQKAESLLSRDDLPLGTGFHWNSAYQAIKSNKFNEYFRQFCLSHEQMTQGIREGRYVVDNRLARFFYISKNGKDIIS